MQLVGLGAEVLRMGKVAMQRKRKTYICLLTLIESNGMVNSSSI